MGFAPALFVLKLWFFAILFEKALKFNNFQKKVLDDHLDVDV
jgi:hypothetical protein